MGGGGVGVHIWLSELQHLKGMACFDPEADDSICVVYLCRQI